MNDITTSNNYGVHQKKSFFQKLSDKHVGYFTVIWYISFSIGMLYGFIRLLAAIFISIRSGDFGGFVFAVLLNSLYTMFWGLLGGIIIFIILVIITIIPYLVIRGIKN